MINCCKRKKNEEEVTRREPLDEKTKSAQSMNSLLSNLDSLKFKGLIDPEVKEYARLAVSMFSNSLNIMCVK